jgi:hypothetical protein
VGKKGCFSTFCWSFLGVLGGNLEDLDGIGCGECLVGKKQKQKEKSCDFF